MFSLFYCCWLLVFGSTRWTFIGESTYIDIPSPQEGMVAPKTVLSRQNGAWNITPNQIK